MCERQITTPSNSLLYCSEACRRKDSIKPLSAATIMTAPPPSSTPPPSSPRSILQPRTPTGLNQHAHTTASRIPTDIHSYRSDLDPTEWKPKSARTGRPASNRYNSEAFRYLSSFHRAINKNESNDNDTPHDIKIEVPNLNSIAATAPTTPSLDNTPTTTASSWSMSTSAGYDYNTRPLMPRHNRWYSTSAVGGSGVDLVTPHIPPPPANNYAKKDVVVDPAGKGGLGAFFGGSVE